MISSFSVLGLWNERNIRINFVDGSIIIVGENGSGKTTVLRILYLVLSRDWIKLSGEDFVRIELVDDNNDRFGLNRSDLQGFEKHTINVRREFRDAMPTGAVNELANFCGELTTSERVREAFYYMVLPNRYLIAIENILQDKEKDLPEIIQNASKWILKHNTLPILYLPTYRRSESSLNRNEYAENRIRRFHGFDRLPTNMEVAQVGMTDVDITIRNEINSIMREYSTSSSELNATFFKDILSGEYKNAQSPEQIIESGDPTMEYYSDMAAITTIFNSISGYGFFSDIDPIKEKLVQLLAKKENYDEYDKIVSYFYKKLIERYERLKKVEEPLEAFFYACNKYLSNKKFKYYPNEFNYKIIIEKTDGSEVRDIDLDHLSSGEKQMVSLFCYVYLANPDKCMVIIDEPELSLSVAWQKDILEDVMESKKCGALIAATQSPFVYNNSLRHLAKSMNSFLSME